MTDVTVVVPVKDRREQMLACLDALLAQDHSSFEVLVLDNGSHDGTPDACRARAAASDVPVRIETVPGTLGQVRNRGARLARSRYIAYTDSDCVPAPGWLRAGTRALDDDPRLGVVCGRTRPQEPIRGLWPKTVRVEELTWRFEACNALYRRDALLSAGGFDEVVGDGWEDTAAGFAVVSEGWGAAYVPEALVHHDVTYPGYWWHLRREQRQRNLGWVVGRHPAIRRRLLWGGVFLNRHQGLLYIAAGALLAGRRHPDARLLAAPYLVEVLTSVKPWRIPHRVLWDVAVAVGVARGALRHRRLVL